jgi:regulator of sirC expression with transglutaminase-like and TPR domain
MGSMTTLFPVRGSAPPLPAAPPPATFEQLAALPDESIDVAVGAALIARDAYATLDVGELLGELGDLASPLGEGALALLSPAEQADTLSHYVFENLGFRGNDQDYYDPRNSLLPDVLGRKLGIPITLALVYCEVARRAGVLARGVSFPGHFLVRIDSPNASSVAASAGANRDQTRESAREPAREHAPVILDPFFGGRRMDNAALQKLLERSAGGQKLVADEHLVPASARTMLVRMLINLKWIYATRGDFARALLALDRIISLTPDSVPALRERGLLAARLGSVEGARADLSRLLELAPQGPDSSSIRKQLEELRAKASVLN